MVLLSLDPSYLSVIPPKIGLVSSITKLGKLAVIKNMIYFTILTRIFPLQAPAIE